MYPPSISFWNPAPIPAICPPAPRVLKFSIRVPQVYIELGRMLTELSYLKSLTIIELLDRDEFVDLMPMALRTDSFVKQSELDYHFRALFVGPSQRAMNQVIGELSVDTGNCYSWESSFRLRSLRLVHSPMFSH